MTCSSATASAASAPVSKCMTLAPVACLLEPDLFDMTKAFVDVEIAGELTAGCTVVDLKGYLKREPNATVTTGVHADRFCDWFMDGIAIVHSPLSLRRR